MVVTVYTKPQCVQCNMTYRALDAKGISYTKIDITEDTCLLYTSVQNSTRGLRYTWG